MHIWEEVGESLPVPKQAEGTEGSVPWANFSPLWQGTIPFLPRFPSPASWEWSEQVLTHGLGGTVHHQGVPSQQLLSPFPVFRQPLCSLKVPGFQQGVAGTGLCTRPSGAWITDVKSACPESHQLRGGRRTGSVLGSTGAGWSCGRPPNEDATRFPSQ